MWVAGGIKTFRCDWYGFWFDLKQICLAEDNDLCTELQRGVMKSKEVCLDPFFLLSNQAILLQVFFSILNGDNSSILSTDTHTSFHSSCSE